jgi:hypothetical protein
MCSDKVNERTFGLGNANFLVQCIKVDCGRSKPWIEFQNGWWSATGGSLDLGEFAISNARGMRTLLPSQSESSALRRFPSR